MAYNGSGDFNRLYSWQTDRDNGVKIRADRMDAEMDGMATGLSTAICKDGQTAITANLPMSGFKHTGVAAATARNHYADVGAVQDSSYIWCGTAGGTQNALTFSPTPAITAYAAGQSFVGIIGASSTNSTVTVAFSGLTAKAVQVNGAALSASVYLESGKLYRFDYDGTQFQATRLAANLLNVLNDPLTTRGDIITRGASATGRLAVGSANTILKSDGTDPSWGQVAGANIAMGSDAQGDILYYNGTAYARLGAGTSGQFLKTQGAGANPVWATGAGLVPLATSTASNSATIDFTTAAAFDGTYLGFVVMGRKIVSATDNVGLHVRLSRSSTFQADATDYRFQSMASVTTAVSSTSRSTGAGQVDITFKAGNSASGLDNSAATSGLDFILTMMAPNRTTTFQRFKYETWYDADDGNWIFVQGVGELIDSAGAVDGIRFLMSSGNITSGVFDLFGIKGS